MFDVDQEMDTSVYADIQRLAPAHVAIATAGRLRVFRYWTLPVDEPLYLRRHDDYVDRFKELLRRRSVIGCELLV